jgi:S1-C subfamily serine protease
MNSFRENGYRPTTKIKDELTEQILTNPSQQDQIHFYKSENTSPELEGVINAAVLVSDGTHVPGGSGVIINFDGNKYIVTATHVIGSLLADHSATELKYFYRNKAGEIIEGHMNRNNMLYDSITAREKGLPVTDIAIFTFDGANDGVGMSVQEVPTDTRQLAVAVGFPGEYRAGWKGSIKPLLSIGKIFKERPREITPYMKKLMKSTDQKIELDLNVFYTGRILPGNSGGPIVDSQGKVIAVCSGPKGTFGKENGIERFNDFRPILKTIARQV